MTYVAAPDRERSAVSMSLSIHQPLRLYSVSERVYAVEGTPTDCINLALQKILPVYPDFVISGMNLGENLGEDVLFSGTVAGAFAAHSYGIPALAVSLIADPGEGAFHFAGGARITASVLSRLLPLKNTRVVYNLNIPPRPVGPIAITSLGCKNYQPSIEERTDPRGRKYFWIGSGYPKSRGADGSDLEAISRGAISLSIIKYDLNDTHELTLLSEAFHER